MAYKQTTTGSIPAPTTRTVYDHSPKPRTPHTPKREYAFMRTLLHIPQGGSFGPIGGVAQ